MQNINHLLYLLQISLVYVGLGWWFCDDEENSLVIYDSEDDDLKILIFLYI